MMSKITINFKVSKQDAAMFITSFEEVINNTRSKVTKKRLINILEEIKFDYWKDDKIFHFVSKLLQGVTSQPISMNSSLTNHLTIPDIWISNTLYLGCNIIIEKLMNLNGTTKPFEKITANKASECKTVKDIINLISTTYENA